MNTEIKISVRLVMLIGRMYNSNSSEATKPIPAEAGFGMSVSRQQIAVEAITYPGGRTIFLVTNVSRNFDVVVWAGGDSMPVLLRMNEVTVWPSDILHLLQVGDARPAVPCVYTW